MKSIWISLRFLFIMTLITGVGYPLLITGLGKMIFPKQSNGSLIRQGNKILGSELIGQSFQDPQYFWPRPSAIDYQPIPSAASNLAPSSAELLKKFQERKQFLETFSPHPPQDLLFSSASGLDPHISLEAARYQIDRVAKQRHLDTGQIEKLNRLIERMTENRDFGILGEKRVHVLKLNLAIDQQFSR